MYQILKSELEGIGLITKLPELASNPSKRRQQKGVLAQYVLLVGKRITLMGHVE